MLGKTTFCTYLRPFSQDACLWGVRVSCLKAFDVYTQVAGQEVHDNFFFLIFFKIYLFLTVLGLRFCARAFSSCGTRGPLFIAVRGPPTLAASLVAEHRLQTRRLSSCGSRAQLPRGMWDPPGPGLEPVFPALAGRLSTTAPPGKPLHDNFYSNQQSLRVHIAQYSNTEHFNQGKKLPFWK